MAFILKKLSPSEAASWHTFQNNYVEWGKKYHMTLEDYVEREKAHFLNTKIGLASTIYVLLKPVNDSEESTEEQGNLAELSAVDRACLEKFKSLIYAQCEIYLRPGYLYSPHSSDKETAITVASFASVFVHPKYRSHGIGKQFMEMVLKDIDTNPQQVKVCSLYSGVGPYYEKFGFESFPVQVYQVALIDQPKINFNEKMEELGVKYVYYPPQATLETNVTRPASPDTVFLMQPSTDIIEWATFRTRFPALDGKEEAQIPIGFKFSNNRVIIWKVDYGKSLLTVMYGTENLALINGSLDCLKSYCQSNNIEFIQVWDNSNQCSGNLAALLAQHGFLLKEDADMLPALRCPDKKITRWQSNECLFWC